MHEASSFRPKSAGVGRRGLSPKDCSSAGLGPASEFLAWLLEEISRSRGAHAGGAFEARFSSVSSSRKASVEKGSDFRTTAARRDWARAVFSPHPDVSRASPLPTECVSVSPSSRWSSTWFQDEFQETEFLRCPISCQAPSTADDSCCDSKRLAQATRPCGPQAAKSTKKG